MQNCTEGCMFARTCYLFIIFKVVAGTVGLILQIDINMKDLIHGGLSGTISSHGGPWNTKF